MDFLSTDFLDLKCDPFLIHGTLLRAPFYFQNNPNFTPKVDSSDIHSRTSLKILNFTIGKKRNVSKWKKEGRFNDLLHERTNWNRQNHLMMRFLQIPDLMFYFKNFLKFWKDHFSTLFIWYIFTKNHPQFKCYIYFQF